jgi:hypothetical protein
LVLGKGTALICRDMQEEKLSFGLRVRFKMLDMHWCLYFINGAFLCGMFGASSDCALLMKTEPFVTNFHPERIV